MICDKEPYIRSGGGTTDNGIEYDRQDRTVTVTFGGIQASVIHQRAIPSGYVPKTGSTFPVAVHYNGIKYIGLLGISNGNWYLTYMDSYPADNIAVPSNAYVYASITYLTDG